MDSREFFRRARSKAATIAEPFVVVVSKETGDGGVAGVMTYASRDIAARLVVKDYAELATKEQSEAYFAQDKRVREEFEAEKWRNRVQVAVIRDEEVAKLTPQAQTPKPEKQ